ncbi:MAG: hypothetical protein KF764_16300 [Labilithrix sp.]|nr:hypothetical protein [Labilithrix sp.]
MTAAVLAVGAAATAAGDDRAAAEAMLKDVEASPRKDAAGDLVTRSRAALERGASLRSSGDEAHARLADSLARTWAEAARDVARAAAVEQSAAAHRRSATDAGVLADRERALLEEAIAQSGRLRAQLDSAQRDAKEQPARTSTTAASDAGARAPAKAPAAAGGKESAPAPKTTADGGAR